MESTINKISDLQEISDALNCNLSSIAHSCHLSIGYKTSLGRSVTIHFSLDKKDKWQNGIYQNSRYITACIFENPKDNTFTFEVASSNAWQTPILKLRKKTATKDKMIKHLTDTFKNIVEKSLVN